MSDKVAFTSLPQVLQDFINQKGIRVGKLLGVELHATYARAQVYGSGSSDSIANQWMFDMSTETEVVLPELRNWSIVEYAVLGSDEVLIRERPGDKYDTNRVRLRMTKETAQQLIKVQPIKMPGQAAALLFIYTHINPKGKYRADHRAAYDGKYGSGSQDVWLDWLVENGLVKLSGNQGRRVVTPTTYGQEIGSRLTDIYSSKYGEFSEFGVKRDENHPDFQLSGGTFSGLLSGGLR